MLFTALLLVTFGARHARESSSRPNVESICSVDEERGGRSPRLTCGRSRTQRVSLSPRHAFTLGRPMDLERATEDDLRLLPRIGRSRARAIIEYRRMHGGLCRIDALLEVRGIGPETLETLRPLITVSPTERCR